MRGSREHTTRRGRGGTLAQRLGALTLSGIGVDEELRGLLAAAADLKLEGKLVECAQTLRRAVVAAGPDSHLAPQIELEAAAAEALVSPENFVSACHGGDEARVRALLDGGVSVNKPRGIDGWTGTMVACYYAHATLVKYLLATGANVAHQSHDGTTATFVAAQMGHLGVLATVLAHGGDPCVAKASGISPLYIATQHSFVDAMLMLLSRGARIAQARNSGATACFVAAQNGCAPALELLLKRGARTDRARKDGGTPLFIAAQNGHTECVELLIAAHWARFKSSAQRNALLTQTTVDATHTFPMFAAAIAERVSVISALANNGAPLEQRTGSGKTPLFGAAQCGYLAGVGELLRRGADIDARADNRATPLVAAAQNGHVAVVAMLLDLGADVRARTSTGWTPPMMAAFAGHRDCLRVMMRAGASIGELFEVSSISQNDERRRKTTQSAQSLLLRKHRYDAAKLLRNSLLDKRIQLLRRAPGAVAAAGAAAIPAPAALGAVGPAGEAAAAAGGAAWPGDSWRDYTVLAYNGGTRAHTLRAEDGSGTTREVTLHSEIFRDTTVLKRQWQRECWQRKMALICHVETRSKPINSRRSGGRHGSAALASFYRVSNASNRSSFARQIAEFGSWKVV